MGHLGFNGTSFWMDRERSVVVILLTNRVHPTRFNVSIRRFRPLLHDALTGALT
ncbi:MAG: serine hydrolase [Desulfosarcinaceae bacterium]